MVFRPPYDGRRAAVPAGRLIRPLSRAFAFGEATFRITASIGLAAKPAGTKTDALLRASDAALYESKAGRCARLVIAPPAGSRSAA